MEGEVAALHDRLFQSPCAGNMFGKPQPLTKISGKGSQTLSFNPRVRGTCLVSNVSANKPSKLTLFQSPCVGNMFGKQIHHLDGSQSYPHEVSIPVCGEHVW